MALLQEVVELLRKEKAKLEEGVKRLEGENLRLHEQVTCFQVNKYMIEGDL